MRRFGMLVVTAALAFTLVSAHSASAQWRFDVYGGMAYTGDTWMEMDARVLPLGGQRLRAQDEIKFQTSGVVGGRLSYSFSSVSWLALGLDAFHFRPDVAAQPGTKFEQASLLSGIRQIKAQVTGITPELIVSSPKFFPSPEMPEGHFQIYATAGPSLFFVTVKDQGNLTPRGQQEEGISPGFKAGVGVSWMVTKRVGLFSEYRVTRFTVDLDDTDFQRLSFGGIPAKASIHTNVLTQHIVFGFAFPF